MTGYVVTLTDGRHLAVTAEDVQGAHAKGMRFGVVQIVQTREQWDANEVAVLHRVLAEVGAVIVPSVTP